MDKVSEECRRQKRLGLQGKKPVTLYFNSFEDAEEWMTWYLDQGGEQDSKYYANEKTSRWVGNDPALHLEKEAE